MENVRVVRMESVGAAEHFAEWMRDARTARGESQASLATRMAERGHASWRQSTVAKAEAGERPIGLGEFIALCELLGLRAGKIAAALADLSRVDATREFAELQVRALELQEARAQLESERLAVELRMAQLSENFDTEDDRAAAEHLLRVGKQALSGGNSVTTSSEAGDPDASPAVEGRLGGGEI